MWVCILYVDKEISKIHISWVGRFARIFKDGGGGFQGYLGDFYGCVEGGASVKMT